MSSPEIHTQTALAVHPLRPIVFLIHRASNWPIKIRIEIFKTVPLSLGKQFPTEFSTANFMQESAWEISTKTPIRKYFIAY